MCAVQGFAVRSAFQSPCLSSHDLVAQPVSSGTNAGRWHHGNRIWHRSPILSCMQAIHICGPKVMLKLWPAGRVGDKQRLSVCGQFKDRGTDHGSILLKSLRRFMTEKWSPPRVLPSHTFMRTFECKSSKFCIAERTRASSRLMLFRVSCTKANDQRCPCHIKYHQMRSKRQLHQSWALIVAESRCIF